jgi:hypothetical protein
MREPLLGEYVPRGTQHGRTNPGGTPTRTYGAGFTRTRGARLVTTHGAGLGGHDGLLSNTVRVTPPSVTKHQIRLPLTERDIRV